VITDHTETFNARNGHSRCLLCGDLNPRSLNLSFHASDNGSVEAKFRATAELQGYDDILHGGIVASLLDGAMTHCLFHQGVQAVTADLRVRFVHGVPCNAFLEIRARVVSSTPPLYRLKSEIVLDGQVMAWAEGKFMKRKSTR